MRRGKVIALLENEACAAVIGAMLMACSSSSLLAAQQPWKDCRAVSKLEYNSAKNQHLLSNRFARYVRTGRVWRRHYWYCPCYKSYCHV
jgi:hypothetical protein